MDAFNYLSVMISVTLGLGLTQLFAGIGNLVQIRRRVKLYWLHSFWVLLLIVLHLNVWWSFWSLRGFNDWTYATFVYVLFGPAVLVIASHIVMPELLEGRIDVEKHYFDTGPIFFGLLAGLAVWATSIEPVMGLHPFFVPFRIVQAVAIVALGSCCASRNKRVHVVATVLFAVLLVIGITLTRYRLGDLDMSNRIPNIQ